MLDSFFIFFIFGEGVLHKEINYSCNILGVENDKVPMTLITCISTSFMSCSNMNARLLGLVSNNSFSQCSIFCVMLGYLQW